MDRFRTFFGAIRQGSSLEELKRAAGKLEEDANRILLGTALVQLSITVAASEHLPSRTAFVGRCRERLGVIAPLRIESLICGLE